MRLHLLQHAPNEQAEGITAWAVHRGHTLIRTHAGQGGSLPPTHEADWLIVTGAARAACDGTAYPSIEYGKGCLLEALARDMPILAIGPGYQLLAEVLGARTCGSNHSEIGWHPVTLSPQGERCEFFRGFPTNFLAFLWGGASFTVPPSACRMAGSEGCFNQAFVYGDCVVGLQFHLEYSNEDIRTLVGDRSDELTPGPYVQARSDILANLGQTKPCHRLLHWLLNGMESKAYERLARLHRQREAMAMAMGRSALSPTT
jgi:GMP synthase-like glutamine amidotransferase